VRIPPSLVEWAIQSTPHRIDVFDRPGSLRFSLGDDRTRFGVGVTNLYYQDPASDHITPFTREHMGLSVRLVGSLPQFDVVSTIGIIQDVSQSIADLYAVLEMIANTTLPVVLLISDESLFPAVLDLLEDLHGDLAKKPFTIPYFNPVTPLVLNAGTTDKMLAAIERGLPFIYSNYGMVGMSTPITPAGTLSLLVGELLAGLVFSQLVREGTPVILGSLPAYFDMKSMVDYYDPRTFLLNIACAEVMQHYHIPHAGTSGSGLGWGSDLLAAGLLWQDHLTACLSVVGLSPFVGGNLGSKAFSPALAVYSNDVIECARRFASGFKLDAASVGLEEIELAGPGGHFLTSDLTLQHYKEDYYASQVFPRISLEAWQDNGQPKALQFLRERTRQLLNESLPPEDHDDLIAKGEVFIDKFVSRGS
jgi:trimethylamine--corrinoid protein Co-methyltransferase